MNETPLKVEIGWNNAGVASICGHCGRHINPFVGYEPFIAGTKTLLCDDCASGGEIVGEMPSGFTLFDQAAIAAEIEEAERRHPRSAEAPQPHTEPDPDDDVPF